MLLNEYVASSQKLRSLPDRSQSPPLRSVDILEIPITALNMDAVLETIAQWIDTKGRHYVCAADVHSIMCARNNLWHRRALRLADMVLPDGMPLVWLSRLRGEREVERVCGPDLMLRVLDHSVEKRWRHYFYGGSEGVAEALAQRAMALYPGLIVAGTGFPPFRTASQEETDAAIEQINRASADILWVGLGCPKQEIWMLQNIGKLNSLVAIGVGAAFDFHSGRIKRAPYWMRCRGLEWLYRLLCEPRRLWWRYLYLAPRFVALNLLETLIKRRVNPQG